MTYTHLTTNELVMIEAYYQEGAKIPEIIKSLGRSKQTIYNVINFLKDGHSAYEYYERYKANKKRCGRRKTSLSQAEKDFIQTHLEQNWSLDVIKGAYSDNISCSMRTLYRLADRGIFKKEDFPWQGKRKPNGHSEKRGKQTLGRDLRERAELYPDFNTEFGHLEGDTIVGEKHKSAVITLVEHLSKAIITLKTNERKAIGIEVAINQWLSQLPKHLFKSITFDCGKEFSNWKSISNTHDIGILFANSGCPGQRGLNEHSNGLLRRHGLPKQMDFNGISQNFLSAIADKRNRIPRKSLNYQTPYQVFLSYVKSLT
ncbi:IS30 family transposase [Streptococcus suis]|uniref:IS30 family protein n=1 Tax=Streptococcus suis TaxID=1307 RepID=M1VNY9_STRSU|nr:IS30 family transposase [Streptococcus suis]MCK3965949.1 IS30 family transposase [Streptococcus suis]MDY7601464.1 IS30 family transposase [Streptococcus suis]NQM44374.1 IS30 family transposase [Streptococcus suis]BAM94722.1 IS30 family protein [Streptococcus suis]HEL1783206.1 IS30 family transposase [Streptococcus suis]